MLERLRRQWLTLSVIAVGMTLWIGSYVTWRHHQRWAKIFGGPEVVVVLPESFPEPMGKLIYRPLAEVDGWFYGKKVGIQHSPRLHIGATANF